MEPPALKNIDQPLAADEAIAQLIGITPEGRNKRTGHRQALSAIMSAFASDWK